MPSYKYKTTNGNQKWFCSFYYSDYQGKKQKKKKEGFPTKREADAWEREFLLSKAYDPDMTFQSLYKLYIEDLGHRLREHTLKTKGYLISNKILPFFGDMPLTKITPVVVRQWQNTLLSAINPHTGEPYSQTYLKTINNQLTATFNYAVKYHNLKENPCHKAGSIGKKAAEEMKIWSWEQFGQFIQYVADKPASFCGFHILFWCGLRIGELLALTWKDIDLKECSITINKSYQRLDGKDVITAPKTPKSTRTIKIPAVLVQQIQDYKAQVYEPKGTDRLFPHTKWYFNKEMERGSKAAGIEKIRVHDLRHSHVSMLIQLGVNPVAIARRVGHEKVETTLNTYAHMYPSNEENMIEKLDGMAY